MFKKITILFIFLFLFSSCSLGSRERKDKIKNALETTRICYESYFETGELWHCMCKKAKITYKRDKIFTSVFDKYKTFSDAYPSFYYDEEPPKNNKTLIDFGEYVLYLKYENNKWCLDDVNLKSLLVK